MRVMIQLSGNADALVLYYTVLHNAHLSGTVRMPFMWGTHCMRWFLRESVFSNAFSLTYTANGSITARRTACVRSSFATTLFLSVTCVRIRFV